jgi:hypothetical protein
MSHDVLLLGSWYKTEKQRPVAPDEERWKNRIKKGEQGDDYTPTLRIRQGGIANARHSWYSLSAAAML